MTTFVTTFKYTIWVLIVAATVHLNSAFGGQDEIIVGISHWPPMKTTQPAFGGIDVLTLQEIEKRIDARIRFLACPWKRCIDMAKTGDIDMVTSFERIKDRDDYAVFIEPSYTQIKNRLYKNTNTRVSVSKYEDLYNYTIGTIKGGVYFPRFDTDTSLKRERLPKEIQQLQMLADQRVDIIIGSEYNLDYLIQKNNFQNVIEKLPLEMPSKNKAHFAMSKKSKHLSLIPKIEHVLEEMIEQGKTTELVDSYFKSLQNEAHQNKGAN